MKIFKRLFQLSLLGGLAVTIVIGGFYLNMKGDLPSVEVLKDVQLQIPMQIYSKDSELISQFGTKRRIPVKLEDMPQQLLNAFLATEDNRFYEHFGVDPIGMTRAIIGQITGNDAGGASTITMQTARNFFLTREKTYIRKLREIFISLHMESLLTKDEILELYLNKIELSHRAFGVGAAAQVYYGKELKDLTLGEMAVIAGLPKAPSYYNPISNPERAKFRRTTVLQRMLVSGYITEDEYNTANNEEIFTKRHGVDIELSAPYIAEMAHKKVVDMYGTTDAYAKGLKVYTTVSGKMQRAAEQAVIGNIYAYDERHGYRGPIKRLWLTEDDKNYLLAQKQKQLSENDYEKFEDSLADVQQQPLENTEIVEQISSTKTYQDLIVAAVMKVNEQSADIVLGDGQQGVINWKQMHWARSYIDDSSQGSAPKKAKQILTVGDLIYVKNVPVEELADDSQSAEGSLSVEDSLTAGPPKQYRLSQLPDVSAGLVAISPDNGAILASVGGYSFSQSQFNRITQANRQVGSNIKPFVYSAALDSGYTLASIINDAPINQWDKSSGFAWRPKNSPAIYEGPLRVRTGLAKSKNVMSVRLLRGMGLKHLISYLERFGFDSEALPKNESLALGSASMTPMQVATGYSAFANGGYLVTPYVIERIEDSEGEVLYQAEPLQACYECEQAQLDYAQSFDTLDDADVELITAKIAPRIISRENAFLVTDMMNSVIWGGGGDWSKGTGWSGTGWRAKTLNRRDLAGKTGTTNESKDAWFSGFSRRLATSVWIGFDNPNRNLGRSDVNRNLGRNQTAGGEAGANAAQPSWIKFMETALTEFPAEPFEQPEGVISIRIDKKTGKRTNRSDKTTRFEFFKKGTEPTQWVTEDNVDDILDNKVEETEEELF
ncbi:penicillin-binding protein 1A [Thalassotalea crassostreae]|uniref:penicillin-binding protein 1A n=1 Tax=Thalassotalea crassostreae TaxID=1763536 RepID=UPI000837FBEC|nr:penicillin-binding protein 1A [Thalassotalea crassostreae]